MKIIRLWPRISITMLLIASGALVQSCNPAESRTAREIAQKPTQAPSQEQPPHPGLATPPELFKPDLPPSEMTNPDAIFRKLDVAKRGYVTLEDASDLLGFEEAFRAADTSGSGRLTPAQFRKAWSIYRSKQ